MAGIDDTIATYLTAIEVEGKTQNTVLSYRASLEDFRRVGRRLAFPQDLEAYSVEHVYPQHRRAVPRNNPAVRDSPEVYSAGCSQGSIRL